MVIAVIPSRYHSTRFPGKALAVLGGVPLVTRVVQAVRRSGVIDEAVVATDDERIAEAARTGGADVWLSREAFRSGSDRVAAAVAACWPAAPPHQIVLNVQGDEPLVGRALLAGAVAALEEHDMGTVAVPLECIDCECIDCECIERECGNGVDLVEGGAGKAATRMRGIVGSDTVKVWLDETRRRAVDFSRSMPRTSRPMLREPAFAHVGVYAFTQASLARFAELPSTARELEEELEQLRALDAGLTIGVRVVRARALAVNRPEDLPRAEAML